MKKRAIYNMYSQNTLWAVVTVSAAFLGAVIGATVRPLFDHLVRKWQRQSDWRRQALEQQLNELYRPLYEKMVVMPQKDPLHYFSDWGEEEFTKWLQDALDIIIPKLHLVPDELLSRIHEWRETATWGEPARGVSAESEVRFLYDHIEKHFRLLRKELGIS